MTEPERHGGLSWWPDNPHVPNVIGQCEAHAAAPRVRLRPNRSKRPSTSASNCLGKEPTALTSAQAAGLAIELVALESGQAPDWIEARGFSDALVLDEIGDDLLELCGIRPRPRPTAHLARPGQARLRNDLQSFRAAVEDDHDEIEESDFRGGRIFAVGHMDDDSNPLAGHGWMCRLVDAGALAAAGFQRVRKAVLLP